MNKIFIQFLFLSFIASIFTLIIFILKPLVKNKLSKVWQYYIWFVIILRLILPFSFQYNLIENHFHNEISFPSIVQGVITENKLVAPPDNPNEYISDEVDQNIEINWIYLMSYIWLIVGCGILIQRIFSYYNFLKCIKAGSFEILNENSLNVYKQVCIENNIKKIPKLYINKLIKSPMLVGTLNCFIILPEINLSQQQLKVIFQHELIHYKRFDQVYKWITQIAVCIHWFNPLVYLIQNEVTKNCELSCDEIIITKLDKQGKQHYGDTLISTMQADNGYSNFIASITLNEDKTLLKERLDSIIKFKKKTKLSTIISFVLTFILFFAIVMTGVQASIFDIYAMQGIKEIAIIETANNANMQEMITLEFGEVPRVEVSVLSENIVVNRGGDSLKIMFDKQYKDNYIVDDYIHSTSNLREVCIERKDIDSPQTEILQTIYITVPENTTWQMATFETTVGNISISNINAIRLNLYSEYGSISCINNNIFDYINAKSDTGNISITLLDSLNNYRIFSDTASNNITIDGKSYQNRKFNLNSQAKKSISLFDTKGVITISNSSQQNNNQVQQQSIESTYFSNKAKSNKGISDVANNNIDISSYNSQMINLNKIVEDKNNIIQGLDINSPATHINLQNSSNNNFEATFYYPQSSASLYKDSTLNMDVNNGTLNINITYPNGEINQNSNVDIEEPQNFATILIKVPSKKYQSVKIGTFANANVNLDIDTAYVDLINYAGNPYIKFIKKCDDININNQVGDLTFDMESIGKKLKVNNNLGNVIYNVSQTPKDYYFKLKKASYDFGLPKDWKNSMNYDRELTYQDGNGSNIIEVYNKMGDFIMNGTKMNLLNN